MGWQKEWAGPGSGPIVRPANSQASLRLGWGGGRAHGGECRVGESWAIMLLLSGPHANSCMIINGTWSAVWASKHRYCAPGASHRHPPPSRHARTHAHTHRNRRPLRRTAPVDARKHTLTVSNTVFLAWWFEESQVLIEISTKRGEKSNTNNLFGTSLPKGMISHLWQTLTSVLMVIYNHRGVKSMDVITST